MIRPRGLLIGLVRGLFDFVSVGSTSSSSTTSQGFFNPFGLREIAAHPPHMTTTLPVCLRRCALSHPAHPISPLDSTPHLRYPTSHSTSSQAIVRSTAHSARPFVCTAQAVFLPRAFEFAYASWFYEYLLVRLRLQSYINLGGE